MKFTKLLLLLSFNNIGLFTLLDHKAEDNCKHVYQDKNIKNMTHIIYKPFKTT